MKVYFLLFIALVQGFSLAASVKSKLACAFQMVTSALPISTDPQYDFSCKESYGLRILRAPFHRKFLVCNEKNTAVTFSIPLEEQHEDAMVVTWPGQRVALQVEQEAIHALMEARRKTSADYFSKQTLQKAVFNFFETQIVDKILGNFKERIRGLLTYPLLNTGSQKGVSYTSFLYPEKEGNIDFQIEGAILPFDDSGSREVHSILKARFFEGYFELIHYEFSKRKIARKARFSIFSFLKKDNFHTLMPEIVNLPALVASAHVYGGQWEPLSEIPDIKSISILDRFGFKVEESGKITKKALVGTLVESTNPKDSFRGVVVDEGYSWPENDEDDPIHYLHIYIEKDGKPYLRKHVHASDTQFILALNEAQRAEYHKKYCDVFNSGRN